MPHTQHANTLAAMTRRPLFTDAELRVIAGRASLPDERPASGWVTDTDSKPALDLEHWQRVVAKGNEVVFRMVMDWRGIDPQTRAATFAPVRLAPDAPLPDWISRFIDLVETSGAAWAETVAKTVEMLAAHAVRNLRASAAFSLGEEAAAGLERRCVAMVEGLLGPTALTLTPTSGPEGIAAFFRRCPVLARLLVQAVDDWTHATLEMLERFAADRAEIVRDLLDGRDPGVVTDIAEENADPHDGGRRVLLLRFSSGDRIVYKPRPLAVDIAFARIVDWLARRDAGFAVKTPHVIDRGGYGWSGFVDHRLAADEAEEVSFYRCAGQLLALAYALDATDLHHENLIADGPWPVPIDLETVLAPRLEGPAASAPPTHALGRALHLTAFGVLHTCLLPVWNVSSGGLVDFGGLGDQRLPGHPRKHRPSRGFIEAILVQHTEAITQGFVETYRLILACRDELLSDQGPLAELAGVPLRFIFRDTAIYTRLLQRSLRADVTGDAADRALALEQLARVLCLSRERPPYTGLVDAEIRALSALDIPRFQIPADGLILSDRAGPLGEVRVAATAIERAETRLKSLDPADLEQQRCVLRGALRARVAAVNDSLPSLPLADAPPPSPEMRVAAAMKLAEDLMRRSILDDEGGMAWITMRHLPEDDVFQLTGGDVSLGYGNAGQGLLFAALYPFAPDGGWDAACRAALRPLSDGIDTTTAAERYRPIRRDPGLYTGVAGVILALLLAGLRIGWDEAIAGAVRLADRYLGGAALRDTDELSVHSGLAGAVIGLLAMEEASPGRGWLERAVEVGGRLAETATEERLAVMAGKHRSGGPVHGPTGVALAALGLLAVTDEAAWGDLARRGLVAVPLSSRRLNWRLAGNGGDRVVETIALELGVLSQRLTDLPDPAQLDLERLADPSMHGRAGVAEVCDFLGKHLDRADWRQTAEALRADLVRRVPRGTLRYFRHDIQGGCPFTLCHGTTGIALHLLQGMPGGLPSLLFPNCLMDGRLRRSPKHFPTYRRLA